ncbi:PTS sugar transporter subunit IIA [Sporosarcina sp.]|uniref:PTS sugar transporter subunit IIA n=1 Tax=Sporosarcina sp. TaxID=49982 RepID=UPI00260BE021|nr:PTS sugar transporter subunit IIA [Sporosarcina sp.]
MIGIVVTGHGGFPNGILESVQLIAGKIEKIAVIPFNEDSEKLLADLESAIVEVDSGKGVVCFTDLAGGTPFNVSGKIAATRDNVRVIGGTNSPMLLSALFKRNLSLDEFTSTAIQDGKDSIKLFEMKKKETEISEDGI